MRSGPFSHPGAFPYPVTPQKRGTWARPEHLALLWSLAPPCGLPGHKPYREPHSCPTPKRAQIATGENLGGSTAQSQSPSQKTHRPLKFKSWQ